LALPPFLAAFFLGASSHSESLSSLSPAFSLASFSSHSESLSSITAFFVALFVTPPLLAFFGSIAFGSVAFGESESLSSIVTTLTGGAALFLSPPPFGANVDGS
jgi:hypothetical protein